MSVSLRSHSMKSGRYALSLALALSTTTKRVRFSLYKRLWRLKDLNLPLPLVNRLASVP